MNTYEEKKQNQVIVSLTSFPAAIDYAVGAVKSLLRGTVIPDKIVLYLTFEQFGKEGIPQEIISLSKENPVFEVRNYDRDIRSYRKLIPALQDFPEATIVTVDDDVEYDKDMLKDLLLLHQQHPNAILAHRAKLVKLDKPYRKWKKFRWYHFLLNKIHLDHKIMQTGVGGVLYPPHSLDMDMIDVELFTSIAPTTDDIWFWAAAVSKGTYIIPVPFGKNKPRGLGKPKSLSLKTTNFKSGTDKNSKAINDILDRFPELRKKL